ncbi:NADP-dependent oxidoreductase [Steroidobacter cummioxidans]|uniref:NADP-dependent oxidoreductase n=1 Tax=Steroidobacter cummioxidans TaxID=1803913 RepID=UPI0019D43764|nr:NADP-dependent oxidoreductase [Steroidobacter cummioxidans]
MATMHAMRIHSFGGPDVIQLDEVPRPEPERDEVLVRIKAASVNPVDYKIRSGQFAKAEQLPMVLGQDMSGTIARCGTQVQDWETGDDVFAMLPSSRHAYAEYVTIKASDAVPKPQSIDHEHAAAVPLAALTAWQGLFDQGGLQRGQHVLIHGGAGGVGHFAVQFAKAAGAKVTATGSNADKEFLRELGADQIIDYKTERFEDRVRDVDLVFDLIGGETQDRSWAVLKPGGTLVSTLGPPSSKDKAQARKASGKGYGVQPNARQLAEIARLIDDGKVRVYVQAVYPMRNAAEAQAHLEREHARGKTVLSAL